MRTKSRKDVNQKAIVQELRERGYDVDIVERPYDIVVSGKFHYVQGDLDYYQMEKDCSVRVEIKSEGGKLSKSQQEYFDKQKHKGSIITAYKTEDITEWFGK